METNGLDKITQKILLEAQREADAILADADEKCAAIQERSKLRSEEIRERIAAEAESESFERVSRAKAASVNGKRNLLLQTQSDLIDSVFDSAAMGVKQLSDENYADLLIGLLCTAFLEQLEAERLANDDASEVLPVSSDSYEILMNQKDSARIGATVLEGSKKRLEGKASADKINRLTLSQKPVSIDGGLILRCGAVESNCSLSILFAQLRRDLEAEVGRTLFGERSQA